MSYSCILLHLVCGTHRRKPWLAADLRPRVFEFIGGIVRDEGGSLQAIGGWDDHFHMLVRWKTDAAIADLMRNVKSRSSLWIHKTFPKVGRVNRWQDGYSVFTVSRSLKEAAERYINNQERRHRTVGFKEELVALLDKHGVEYDPRYVFA